MKYQREITKIRWQSHVRKYGSHHLNRSRSSYSFIPRRISIFGHSSNARFPPFRRRSSVAVSPFCRCKIPLFCKNYVVRKFRTAGNSKKICSGSGNGVRKRQRLTGTAKRQRKNGNGMVEIGHKTRQLISLRCRIISTSFSRHRDRGWRHCSGRPQADDWTIRTHRLLIYTDGPCHAVIRGRSLSAVQMCVDSFCRRCYKKCVQSTC